MGKLGVIKNTAIFQIYYDSKTKALCDPEFKLLDNQSNERPDWAEYWPIRKYLLSHDLKEDFYYGFFSPRFKEKTRLNSAKVYAFLNTQEHADLFSFSPFFDQAAFYKNIFEQASVAHKTEVDAFQSAIDIFGKKLNLSNLVMQSESFIFSNYFIAKKKLWLEWFQCCEKIFDLCERNDSALSEVLLSHVPHRGSTKLQLKVFLIERLISYLICVHPALSVKTLNPLTLPCADSRLAKSGETLLILDALKTAYCKTNRVEYLALFQKERQKMLKEKSTYQDYV